MNEPLTLPTVLLVDDDDSLRNLLQRILEEHGYHVLPASNGPDAIGLCREFWHPIALLLTDVEMPGMSGFELAAQALRLHPGMKVLFVSGNGAGQLGRAAGFNADVLAKPFETSVLIRNITQLLRQQS